MSLSVEEYIEKNSGWKPTLELLRRLMLATEMQESVKWGLPTYTVNGKNVAGIGAFKSYVSIWFFNGSLLEDKKNVLINAQEGKTVGMRQWRFSTIDEIDTSLVKLYLNEAIKNQKEGKEIKPSKSKKVEFPEELTKALENNPNLKTAFGKFSPYKQKEFAEFILEAKREATKLKRLEKIIPMILEGTGLNDKYRK